MSSVPLLECSDAREVSCPPSPDSWMDPAQLLLVGQSQHNKRALDVSGQDPEYPPSPSKRVALENNQNQSEPLQAGVASTGHWLKFIAMHYEPCRSQLKPSDAIQIPQMEDHFRIQEGLLPPSRQDCCTALTRSNPNIRIWKYRKTVRTNLIAKSLETRTLEVLLADKQTFHQQVVSQLGSIHLNDALVERLLEEAIERGFITFQDLRKKGYTISMQRIVTTPKPKTPQSTLHEAARKPVEDDPYSLKDSRQSEKMIARCQKIFDNNRLRSLPRHLADIRDAVKFTRKQLNPWLLKMYGTEEYFFHLWSQTKMGQRLLDDRSSVPSFGTQETPTHPASALKEFKMKLSPEVKEKMISPDRARRPAPSVLKHHKDQLIPMINSHILDAVGPTFQNKKAVWSQVTQQCAEDCSDLEDMKTVHAWLSQHVKDGGTFLKTLYLSQLAWNDEWDQVVMDKGGHSQLNAEDWRQLLPQGHELIPHAPYLLPELYEMKHNINPRVRRKPHELVFGTDPTKEVLDSEGQGTPMETTEFAGTILEAPV